ncbi:hypothetical protein M2459_003704 [Parabacteroides sp. PF5-5]|uniref:DUF6249 domain-containing protein n=1 Tax=unclassified Parabacteroides TaxID=2649774 RepID=UPI0024746100|nr:MULTISPECIES: DUF6249 domain-containing protein [unclassified Parabacteroides]MDH6307023.1 hypothetical protein [Parabacteroides sp. PH5-39]MDH6317938.1 hypothetical protein [Parabacteroides sp. PF5-13]MDH6321658.1 ABC-type Fe3+-siderophore transport system permease subunit [Parabacteroides sp. PH5-13]MDH6325409.1 ABC-type Fe3+-siderophore transport system permease subunit [Parabacteroides sp. PH5-8]MDH6329126.1 ABC-type Fe3+-siderophore transport system permease subunit [Parabacteroides sp
MGEDILIPIAGMIFVIALPVVVIAMLAHKTEQAKHAERLAMIEKGIIIEKPQKVINRYNALRNGLLMVGLSVGAICGVVINRLLHAWEGGFLIFVLAVLGGGIAYICYFFLARKMQRGDEDE